MIVVADTGPLNYLILLGLDGLLRDFYTEIVAPSAVMAELQHPRAPAPVRAWASDPPEWLKVILVTELDATLDANLGLGEREAISLAIREHAGVLLMNDNAA